MSFTLRNTKGSPLTHAELDANFSDISDTSDATKGDALVGVKHTGTGAVATTQHAVNDLEVNLWHFLSATQRADMGTASLDISDAVATAIAALGSNGGTIVVPGYFGLGATGIAISSKTGVVIEGRGPKAGFKAIGTSTTTVAANGVSWLRMTSSTRCGFRNLYIDNDSKAHNAVAGSANTDCFIEGNHIVNGGLNASIFFVGGTGNRFVRNTVKDSAANSRGMWIGNVNSGEAETDCLIQGNYTYNCGHTGIGGNLVRGVISNNRCVDNDGSGIVQASDVSAAYAHHVTITGNVCKGNAFHGIQVGDPSSAGDYVEQIAVNGNVCTGNTGSGIGVFEARDATISGNVCNDNNAGGGGSTDAGILVSVGKNIVISGNECNDTRAGASREQLYGISLNAATAAADIENVQVTGNVCRNNLTHGIFLVNSGSGTIDTVSVVGNMCMDNGTDGIRVADVADGNIAPVTCVGNTCLGNGTNDLRVDPTKTLLSGNYFSTQSNVIPTFTDQDATPSVSGRSVWRCNNSGGATTITNFDDGMEGQEITVIFADANTTINDAGNFRLSAAFSSTGDDVLKLVLRSSVWYEVSRSVN